MFTLGSAIWTVNGFFSFLPSLYPSIPINNYVLGYTALAGGTVFEIGSYMMVLESLNRRQVVCTLPYTRVEVSYVSEALVRRSITNALTISTTQISPVKMIPVTCNNHGSGGVPVGQNLDFWQV